MRTRALAAARQEPGQGAGRGSPAQALARYLPERLAAAGFGGAAADAALQAEGIGDKPR